MSTFRQVTTDPDEIIERGGEDHQRVMDIPSYKILLQILNQLKKIELHLSSITDEELKDDY